jgi:signal transduction histidine kinase
MLFVLLSLWSISATLLLIDRKSGSTRWLGAVAFCGGAGALAVVLGEQIIPYMQLHGAHTQGVHFLYVIQVSASLVSYYGMPLSFIMFALHYRRILPVKSWYTGLPYILCLPPVFFVWYRPDYSEDYPIYFHLVSWWVIPYILAGTWLVLSRKEWNLTSRRIHGLTCLAVIPAVLFSTFMNYVLPSLGLYKMWKYNTWIIAFGFTMFLIAIFGYGFMGIRILIQKRQLDSTLRAITSGTAILNHAIKNDVGKMMLFCEKMNSYAAQTDQKELMQDIQVITTSAEHIQEMVRRVHHQTQDLELQKENVDIGELLKLVIKGNELLANESKVVVEQHLEQGLVLHADKVQLMEAVNNVWVNALEALPLGGRITVRARTYKKHLEIEIEDNGIGINKKDMPMILEPFFTTKAGKRHNYGLGLAYTYHVTKKHGGTLDIRNVDTGGTRVIFRFPIKLDRALNRGATSDGANPVIDRRG